MKYDGWLICDRNVCLYSEWGARKLDRCVKHGAILTWLGWGTGWTRAAVRAKMREQDARAEARR